MREKISKSWPTLDFFWGQFYYFEILTIWFNHWCMLEIKKRLLLNLWQQCAGYQNDVNLALAYYRREAVKRLVTEIGNQKSTFSVFLNLHSLSSKFVANSLICHQGSLYFAWIFFFNHCGKGNINFCLHSSTWREREKERERERKREGWANCTFRGLYY